MTRREWLAVSSLACMAGCGKPAASRSYPASREEHGNPERGFYVQRAAEDPGDLSNLRSRGISLVLLTLNLQHYRNRPLDDAKLSVLDVAMRQIRKAGLKVIFRAAYGFTAADYRVDPQDLALIGRHITVMARVKFASDADRLRDCGIEFVIRDEMESAAAIVRTAEEIYQVVAEDR